MTSVGSAEAGTGPRSELVVGVNDVTRALQAGSVRLVLVCKDVSPAVMVSMEWPWLMRVDHGWWPVLAIYEPKFQVESDMLQK